MLNIFSCVCQPSVCLLWRNVYFFGPLFDWVFYFSGIELQELLVYFLDQLFVSCFICYYFLPFRGCLFTLLRVYCVVQGLLSLIWSICLFLLLFPIFWEVIHRGSCSDICQRVFCLCSSLGVLQFLVLCLDCYSILSLLLCMLQKVFQFHSFTSG